MLFLARCEVRDHRLTRPSEKSLCFALHHVLVFAPHRNVAMHITLALSCCLDVHCAFENQLRNVMLRPCKNDSFISIRCM